MTHKELQAFVKANYGTMRPKDIAAKFGLTPNRIRQIARRMGMYKYPARKPNMAKCGGCLLNADGVCIYHLEAAANRCRTMRYTKGKWPEKTTIWTTYD